jgi:hypothetical protein
VPIGTELQVNSYTSGAQATVQVAVAPNGAFVAVWASSVGDGSQYGVIGRRFNSAGTPLATEFQVNTYTLNDQFVPAAAAGASSFVVVWQSELQDGAGWGIFGRRLNSAGNPVAVEFRVNAYTAGNQQRADVTVDADGEFVVAWDGAGSGDADGVFGRRFSAAATPQASEFRANATTAGVQVFPAVDAEENGDFVIVWDSPDVDMGGVFGQRFTSAASPVGPEFPINANITGVQQRAAIGLDADGDFTVVWTGDGDASSPGIFGRRFDSSGTPAGSDFQVNTYVTGTQYQPAITLDGDGDFVVAWQSNQDGSSSGIVARRFRSPAVPSTGEFLANTTVSGIQSQPAIDSTAAGDFVVAWQSADGSGNGGFVRRFDVPITLDVDGNGVLDALTDGLLVLRFSFGFTGSTLITNAVGAGCTRCDAPSITAYLQGLV